MLNLGIEALDAITQRGIPSDHINTMIMYLEENTAELSADIVRQYADIRNTNAALENLMGIQRIIADRGVTPELIALVGADLRAVGINISSTEGIKEIGKSIYDGIVWLLKKIGDAFVALWKMIKGIFTKEKTKAIDDHAASAQEAVKEIEDKDAAAKKLSESGMAVDTTPAAQSMTDAMVIGGNTSNLVKRAIAKFFRRKRVDSKESALSSVATESLNEAFNIFFSINAQLTVSNEAFMSNKFPRPAMLLGTLTAAEGLLPLVKFMAEKYLELISTFTTEDVSRLTTIITNADTKLKEAARHFDKIFDPETNRELGALMDHFMKKADAFAEGNVGLFKRIVVKATASLYAPNLKEWLDPSVIEQIRTKCHNIAREASQLDSISSKITSTIAHATKYVEDSRRKNDDVAAAFFSDLIGVLQSASMMISKVTTGAATAVSTADRALLKVSQLAKAGVSSRQAHNELIREFKGTDGYDEVRMRVK